MNTSSRLIWVWAAGYFACYAPYSALTKALSSGHDGQAGLDGVALLPLSTLASLLGMAAFMLATGWWRAASQRTVRGVALSSEFTRSRQPADAADAPYGHLVLAGS